MFLKLIIPMAGKGPRLGPHTQAIPKPLIHVAGKPILLHILDRLSGLSIDKAIFIVDKNYPEITKLVNKQYKLSPVLIQQKQPKGIAHAVLGAKNHIKNEEVLVIFSDTIVTADNTAIKKLKADGIIWTQQVEDPREYGVVFEHNGNITKIIEKPETPVSDKAVVGMYYFKNSDKLFESAEWLVKNNIKSHGEYQFTDAIQKMIDSGIKLKSSPVKEWYDCGTMNNLLNTNAHLLNKSWAKYKPLKPESKDSLIIKPVFIEKGAKITRSIIGPNVSIGSNSTIKNSIILNSILSEETDVQDAVLNKCVIGKNAKVKGTVKSLNVGDDSEVNY